MPNIDQFLAAMIGTRSTRSSGRSEKRKQNEVDHLLESASKRRKIRKIDLQPLQPSEITKFSPDYNRCPTEVAQTISSSEQNESDTENQEMSEFEKRRLQNLRDNAAFLSQLGISEARTNLKKLTESKQYAPSSRGLKEKKPVEILPRRSSLRLKRIDPLGIPLPELPQVPLYESEDEIVRKPSGPLEMGEYLKNVEDEEVGAKFLTCLRGLKSCLSELKKEVQPLKSYMKSLSSLKITENRVAKLTPSRIFSMAIHPTEEKVLACAGDKWGKVAFWDVESTDGQDGVFCYEPHSRPVNCLKFHPQQPGQLYSCSYDGTLRCAHFQKGVFDEVYSTPEEHDVRLTSLDFLSPNTLIASQSDGAVAVSDMRTEGSSAESIYRTHQRTAKCVSVHPTQCQYFATASNDGNVCLWDVRKMSKKNPSSIDVMPHSKSVDSAYFSPVTGQYLLTTAMDDRIRIFELDSKIGGDVTTKLNIRHFNHTGRWLTNFRATWHPSREDLFVVGSMNRPREIEIYNTEGQVVKLWNTDWLGSVCSLNVIHPTRSIIVGGNSSGRVHVFM